MEWSGVEHWGAVAAEYRMGQKDNTTSINIASFHYYWSAIKEMGQLKNAVSVREKTTVTLYSE